MRKFKKLRRAYRIFFPKLLSEKEIFEGKLIRNPEISRFEIEDTLYKVFFKNGLQVYLRGTESSDILVLEQLFNFKEYQLVYSILALNTTRPCIIIDAGANVGYTSVFFASQLKNCSIYAIEPSFDNFEMLKLNTKIYRDKGMLKLYKNALAHIKGLSFEINSDFRDGKDWALSTVVSASGKVAGITLQEIIEENKIQEISFLKIDIEGAERFLFDNNNDLLFLKMTKIIAIEIHDEYNSREEIISILKENQFLLLESGELTIGINKSLL